MDSKANSQHSLLGFVEQLPHDNAGVASGCSYIRTAYDNVDQLGYVGVCIFAGCKRTKEVAALANKCNLPG